MSNEAKDILKLTRPGRIMVPVVLGLGIASFLLYRNFDSKAFENVSWTLHTTLWLLLAVLMVVVRDWAYMVRIRVLTNEQLSWKKCFEVIMLWEFCSAMVPPALGGGFAFAIFIIHKEDLSMGKSISVVMFTSFLDGLFFALVAPLVYFTVGHDRLFGYLSGAETSKISYGMGLAWFFWIVYFVVLLYKILVAYALFVNARAVKAWLVKFYSFKPLRRWRYKALKTGTEMEIAAKVLKKESLAHWIKSFAATCVSWTARFIIINCIIKAFSPLPLDHWVAYGRQVVMGIINIASPTPGGAGLAEWLFEKLLGEFINNPSLTLTLAMLWRLISYYPYLFIGAIIIPRWVKRVYTKTELKEVKQEL